MSQIGIYLFSGTGNTEKCAAYLKDELAGHGEEARLFRVEQDAFQAQDAYVLCFPIHGFNPALPMRRFCKALPKGRGDVWLLKVSGEAGSLNTNASSGLIRLLRKKGYTVKGEFHVLMPYNMIFRHSDAMAAKMWEAARQRLSLAAAQIHEGEGCLIRPTAAARVLSFLCRIEYGFYPFNGRLFRVDAKRCTRCMRCVKSCPTGNIRFDGTRFHFGGKCVECTRCSFGCPTGAIHIGILDFMRVNGRYDFSADPSKAVIGRYCRRSYQRYFSETPKK